MCVYYMKNVLNCVLLYGLYYKEINLLKQNTYLLKIIANTTGYIRNQKLI